MNSKIARLRKEVQEELTQNILPFWINKMTDHAHGGFYGRITGDDQLDEQANKGLILNARILWTFSGAYRLLGNEEYLRMATRAEHYLREHFLDPRYGGLYWEVDYLGNPTQTKNQIYALGFAIYGLSEYYRATRSSPALELAIHLFERIERYSFDPDRNGYLEAFTIDWQPIEDMRLSEKDENTAKTMNTHLHILEAYTGLYRIWKEERLRKQLLNLVELFANRILDRESGHLNLFFSEDWELSHRVYSYGHDIEASWLLQEAALTLDDKATLEKIAPIVKQIAKAADEGLMRDGSLIYEFHTGNRTTDSERHWWVQAENVVGHLNLYQYHNDKAALDVAIDCWHFIQQHLIDHKNGEWYWSIYQDGSVNRTDDKAGFWKCPYHNGRMCMEILERTFILE